MRPVLHILYIFQDAVLVLSVQNFFQDSCLAFISSALLGVFKISETEIINFFKQLVLASLEPTLCCVYLFSEGI